MKLNISLILKTFGLLFLILPFTNSLTSEANTKTVNAIKNTNNSKSKSLSKNKIDYLNYIANLEKKNKAEENGDNFKFKSTQLDDPRKKWKYPVAAGEVLEEWMAIASKEFLNNKRFPPIKLANDQMTEIKVTPLNFRLNSAVNCTDPAKPADDRLFYFRLTDNHIYYSATSTDINILGYITITDVTDVDQNNDISGPTEYFCFTTKDDQFKEWKVCNPNKETINKWFCSIKKYLGLDAEVSMCWGIPSDPSVKIVEKKITQPIIMIPLPSPFCNANWNYQQFGDDWVCDCKDGKEQSPIDLPKSTEAIVSPIKPIFQYFEIEAINTHTTLEGLMTKGQHLHLLNSDNMIHIIHQDMGKITTTDGAVYQAEEITFHLPANHKIDGKEFAMEMSIIHYGITKGDIGKQAILTFVFEAVPGVYNKFLEDLDLFNLPDPFQKKREISKPLYIPKVLYEVSNESSEIPIMKPFSFYTYQGSLPFPPCTEKTIVYVASKPLKVSTTTIALMKEALRFPDLKSKTGEIFTSEKMPVSGRAVQNRNGRPVFFFDHETYCGPDPGPKPKPKSGHYEKVVNKGHEYFYVNGVEPSGLPGAFVVSEREAKGLNRDNN